MLSVDNFDASNQPYTWPGEGDDMIFIDGETWPPSLHGTGTEDYFNAAAIRQSVSPRGVIPACLHRRARHRAVSRRGSGGGGG